MNDSTRGELKAALAARMDDWLASLIRNGFTEENAIGMVAGVIAEEVAIAADAWEFSRQEDYEARRQLEAMQPKSRPPRLF